MGNNGIFDWHDYNNSNEWNRSLETWKQIDKLQMREIENLKKELNLEKKKNNRQFEILEYIQANYNETYFKAIEARRTTTRRKYEE